MPRHSDYIPLHLHTEYSLLDGSIKIDELVEQAEKYHMPAIAITDHGNLFGAIEFYQKASKSGLKPIIGCEVYISQTNRFDKKGDSPFHLILLAMDSEGYRNLSHLITKAYTEGFYYKPRIDKELLGRYSKGLIALSSCLKGEIPYYLSKDLIESARNSTVQYIEIFGKENFFIELQDNGLQEQVMINRRLVEIAKDFGLQVVATNDCHYLKPDDARAHDILLCIQTGKTINDPERMRFGSQEFYFKSPEEMIRAFSEIPSAIKNTRAIAERCSLLLNLNAQLLPDFDVGDGRSPESYLEKLALKGLEERLGRIPPDEYSKRLSMELSVITRMNYAAYFLIVWDFIRFAREKGIPVGPGRGSAAGSLVAYCLGITEIDPIKYNLLFERFLNPERISMPDIDVDFCTNRRSEVIEYVSKKYGDDRVAQIITFGTMAARAAIRDVGRALAMPYAEVDKIAKMVPERLNITIRDALSEEPRLKEIYETNPKIKELIDIAMRLEGLCRHASTHAAGVVVSPRPLTEVVPLYKNPTDNTITTQFDMKAIESLGLLKFDFLGLKTLTVIEKTLNYIKDSKGINISLKDISLEDEKTYKLLCSGQTTGIFQLESAGMRELLIKMQPDRFEDLIALVALYRPGPLGSGMVDEFIKRKRGIIPVAYEIPELEEILKETYGVILYQEQVMRIANKIANFSMGKADILRKAMGKKQPEEMEKQKEDFLKGAISNGIPEKKASRLFDLIALFAEYGFNKSHSAAYAYLAYQTAYLKAHYSVEFMAANLSADIGNTDKIMRAISECRNMSIQVLPPDINESDREFKVIGNAIRFGLEAVKGVGSSAADAILRTRKNDGIFGSFEDFLRRMEGKRVNKKAIESLIKAGAFDSLGIDRKSALLLLERPAKRTSVYDLFGGRHIDLPFLNEEKSSREEILRFEKESLGFYITDHPLLNYRKHLSSMNYKKVSELEEMPDGAEILIGAVITGVKKIRTKDKGAVMAYLTVEDEEGNIDIIIFPDLYSELISLVQKDSLISIRGTIDKSEKGTKIIAREIHLLDRVIKSQVEIRLPIDKTSKERLVSLRDVILEYPGRYSLYLNLETNNSIIKVKTDFYIEPSKEFIKRINDLTSGEVFISDV